MSACPYTGTTIITKKPWAEVQEDITEFFKNVVQIEYIFEHLRCRNQKPELLHEIKRLCLRDEKNFCNFC